MAEIDSVITRLREVLQSVEFNELIPQATAQNAWFTRQNIERAVEAIIGEMLDVNKVHEWLGRYDISHVVPRRVGIVMAGNIPMVGFFDLLCALLVGHTPVVKLSSKDSILMGYVARRMGVEVVDDMMGVSVDMLIATGSSETARIYASHFASVPTLTRGERHSIAVLSGSETEDQLCRLLDDMFLYWGLGCRNVNRIYLPQGFDLRRIPRFETDFKPFVDSHRYHRALFSMQCKRFVDKGSYLLVEVPVEADFVSSIGVVGYSFYDVAERLNLDHNRIQCVVSSRVTSGVDFGKSQSPQLCDYPDGVDVIGFLTQNTKTISLKA